MKVDGAVNLRADISLPALLERDRQDVASCGIRIMAGKFKRALIPRGSLIVLTLEVKAVAHRGQIRKGPSGLFADFGKFAAGALGNTVNNRRPGANQGV